MCTQIEHLHGVFTQDNVSRDETKILFLFKHGWSLSTGRQQESFVDDGLNQTTCRSESEWLRSTTDISTVLQGAELAREVRDATSFKIVASELAREVRGADFL